MDVGGLLLGEDGAQRDIATLLYVCFPLPPFLAIFFIFCRLDKGGKVHLTNTDWPADNEQEKKEAMLNVWIFFMIVIAFILN